MTRSRLGFGAGGALFACALVMACSPAADAAGAGRHAVKDNAGIIATFKNAKPGDTITLAPGDYGAIVGRNLQFAAPGVTITSQDPNNPAQVAGIELSGSSGITFSNLDLKTNPRTMRVVIVNGSNNIRLDRLNLTSDENLGPAGKQEGLLFRSDTNVSITNSNFHDLGGGPRVLTSSDVVMSGNTFRNIHGDGIQVTSTSRVTIDGNHFTNFIITNPLAHPDAIQFFTTNQAGPATDITVTNNVFVRGTGSIVQGVFLGNEKKIPYENVVISGNTIIGGMYNGIAIGYAKNVQITNNTVQGYADMNSWIYWNHVDGGVAHGNTATSIRLTEPGNTNIKIGKNKQIRLAKVGDVSNVPTGKPAR